ncbi:hypothetical protein [Peribacillus sp. FSL E2-0218]|uniref:hypothetical protein n=1 Tax=Peribacillus sp. FSL E2-0218 TaxID=2921364 RepID=UPI0030ECF980
MTWIDYTTLGVSVGTFLYLVINGLISFGIKKKDRKITVFLEERRKMHNELFHHITSVLDLGRKCEEVEDFAKRQEMKMALLNHKIFIWVNLNKENEFAKQLRSNCNEYIFKCAGNLEREFHNQDNSFSIAANKNVQHIWILIDKYIEKENELKEELI